MYSSDSKQAKSQPKADYYNNAQHEPSSSRNASTQVTSDLTNLPETGPPPYTEAAGNPQHMEPQAFPNRGPVPPTQMSGPPPSSSAPSRGVAKPIAIPATSAAVGSPFLPAYPPVLQTKQFSSQEFLDFLDKLNSLVAASPPLQILGLAGNIFGFIPGPHQMIGPLVSTGAKLAAVAVSKGSTEIFLRKANAETFAPRGLKVEIARIDAVAKLAQIPIPNAEGKIDKKSSLLTPLEGFGNTEMQSVNGQQRRLMALEPWIEKLEITPLPQVRQSSNPLMRLQQAASGKQRHKAEGKTIENRQKAHEDFSKDSWEARQDYDKEMRKLDEEEAEARRKGKQKDLSKIAEERAKVEQDYEKEMGKVNEDKLKDDKEEKMMRKVLWLIIRNLGDDSGSGENPYTG